MIFIPFWDSSVSFLMQLLKDCNARNLHATQSMGLHQLDFPSIVLLIGPFSYSVKIYRSQIQLEHKPNTKALVKSKEVCTKHEWNPWATQDPYQPKIPCLPKIPVIPRSQSTQDPSHPKIPVIPRSQSSQDSSQPKIPVSTGWPHAYLIFASCLFVIWLMLLYLAHVKFTSTKFFKHILHYMAKVHFSKLKKMNETRTCYIFI